MTTQARDDAVDDNGSNGDADDDDNEASDSDDDGSLIQRLFVLCLIDFNCHKTSMQRLMTITEGRIVRNEVCISVGSQYLVNKFLKFLSNTVAARQRRQAKIGGDIRDL